MGLGDFFRRRRERESALPQSELSEAQQGALGSFARSEGQPVVGSQVGGGQPDFGSLEGMDGLAALTQLGPMIQQAMASGNVQIQVGEPQTIDMRGSDLGAEIKQIMRDHGIDPDGQTGAQVDASAYGDMQRQMLEALARHGIDPGASGTSLQFGTSPDTDK